MTRVIERMEERGLVLRRGDASDRRRVRVFLKPQGRALAERLVALARAHEEQVLAALPPPARAALKPMLATLLAALPGNPLDRREERDESD